MTTATNSIVTATLRRAAERAMLAPSIHNTQPWTFVVSADSLEIRADRSRQLAVLDPRSRQLMISCGCALFNARVGIAAAGFEPLVERFPDPAQPELVARVRVGGVRDWIAIAALDTAVDQRRTNRRAFSPDPVPAWVIRDLVAAGRHEGAGVMVITEPEHRAATARLSRLADEIENADPAYVQELHAWTTDDPRRRDGVQASTVPYLGELTQNDDAFKIREFDLRGMGWLPPSSRSGIDQCLLLITCDDDGPAGWLRSGEALEHLWLELTRQAYWASPLSQVIEVGRTHERLRTELGLRTHPEILLRVGRAPDTVHTRRRHRADVIVDAG